MLGTLRGRKGQEYTDLNAIQSKKGIMAEDAKEAHRMISEEFEDTFYGKPVWCSGALHEGDRWIECLRSERVFLEETQYTEVPLEMRRLLYKAIDNIQQRDKVEEDITAIMTKPPTLTEFEEGIRKCKVNSSAGMTGVSYNMLKKLPASMVKSLHYCLTRLWNTEHVPEWWKQRWIVPIPKKEQDIVNVGNLRPRILVDAVRKIWSKLILQRILRVWKDHDVLQHNQHGFRTDKIR